MISSVFEVLMLVCFAASWPFNILASWRARTARNKSVMFELIVEAGYVFGMVNKVVNDQINYVLAFYLLDFALVLVDLLIYLRNRRLDMEADAAEARCSDPLQNTRIEGGARTRLC